MAKKTPFYNKHVELNADIHEFAGYEMPIRYSDGIIKEHLAVRDSVGMFDLSHMGEFFVSGKDALNYVQTLITNDASTLDVEQVLYTTMCYEDGGIVDDLLVYRFEDKFMLVVNAANIDKDWEWCSKIKEDFDVELENKSDEIGLLAIQGPNAENVLETLTDENLSDIGFYHFIEGEISGVEMIISRTGYTGEDGFELYLAPEHCEKLWDEVADAGKEYDIKPVGLGARDTLRLEMKYCLYGNDIDETTTPLEAGLSWVVKFDKDVDFIGKEPLLEQKKTKSVNKRLIAFEMKDRSIPRPGYTIYSPEDEVIGEVTSGTKSPSLSIGIGLGYVDKTYRKSGTEIQIQVRKRMSPAVVVKPPFYKDGSRK